MKPTKDLISAYYDWLKAKTSFREINQWIEITTPYLDRHNDYIQIYLREDAGGIILTDDGYTLSDLAQSGCEIDTPKRKALLQSVLNGLGVNLHSDALEARATEENFSLQKHNLVQAILAVNDLFYVARANVQSFFFEDVALWLDESDIRYTPRVTFAGHSRYTHQFDFVVPKSRNAPERILKVINNPSKDNVQSAAFAWVDTKEARPADSLAFAILNDRDRGIGESVTAALHQYNITPVLWSRRGEFKERLAA